MTRPDLLSLGDHPPRSQDIRERLQRPVLASEEQRPFRLRLFLEALCPSTEPMGEPSTEPIGEQLQDVIHAAHFTPPLSQLVTALLQPAMRQGAGAQLLIQTLRQRRGLVPPPRPDQLNAQIHALRKAFHQTFRKLHNAAAGKIERTHCRQAWRRFITEIEDHIRLLFPDSPAWDVREMRRFLAGLPSLQAHIADDGEVKFKDRKRWERAADQIHQEAVLINELAAQRASLAPGKPAPHILPLEAADLLLQAAPSACEEELLCQRLFQRLVDGSVVSPDALSIPATDLQGSRLRGLLSPDSADPPLAEDVQDPLRCASLLLLPRTAEPAPPAEQVAVLLQGGLGRLRALRQQSEALALQDLSERIDQVIAEATPEAS